MFFVAFSLPLLLFTLCILLARSLHAIRPHDRALSLVSNYNSHPFTFQVPLCSGDNSISFPFSEPLLFDHINCPLLYPNSSYALVFTAHEGIVQHCQAIPISSTTTPIVFIRWKQCTFDIDEEAAVKLLLAFGSLCSFAVFVSVLLDSRRFFKRLLDKVS
jgi:hypothetical protein